MKQRIFAFMIAVLIDGTLLCQPPGGTQKDVAPDGRGARIRGTPGQTAASIGAAVTGNGINYHNGPVMHSINLYFLYYGNWTALDPGGPGILEAWARAIGGSPWFNINTTYGDTAGNVPNVVNFVGRYSDSGSLGTSLSDANIYRIVSNAIRSGQLGTAGVADPNGLYMVLTAPGVTATSGFLSSYCGWHSWGTYSTTPIQYAFIGNAAGPSLGSCAQQTSSSPNGDPGADAMVSVMSHELAEAVSDPRGNAWYDSAGNENGDKCGWNFGATYAAANGAHANVRLGTNDFLIQQNWLNGQGGRCVMAYWNPSDFDGNGHADLIWQNATGTTAIWYMGGTDGSTILSGKQLASDTSLWRMAAAADLNGDGKPDLLWQNTSGSVVVWYMGGSDGSAYQSAKLLSGDTSTWKLVGAADLDGNGRADLIWQNATGTIVVWYMGGADGSSVLGYKQLFGDSSTWRFAAIADLNGDGKPDILRQSTTGAVTVWYMSGTDGSTILSSKQLAGDSTTWKLVGAADLDGNGTPDLLWQNTTGTVVAWYMGGTDGSTILSSKQLAGDSTWRVTAF